MHPPIGFSFIALYKLHTLNFHIHHIYLKNGKQGGLDNLFQKESYRTQQSKNLDQLHKTKSRV